MALAQGDHLGPYEILGRLGSGGMGQVYRARDPKLGREVALKILPEHLVRDPVSRARFEREARAVAALSHPNILGIYDFDEEGEVVYAAMELLEGETLRERLGGRPLPASKAVEIALAIAQGLSAAHDKGIVHRDLKPENVFLTRDGQVKVLDFGMAKADLLPAESLDETTAIMSRPGAMFGTIEYMSPEQIRGDEVDGRADVFALGVVLYEMLTGSRPFRSKTLADVMTAILTRDPAPIDADRQLPAGLEQILHHCLEKQAEERFQSAHDLAFALSAVSVTTSVITTAPVLPYPGRRRWRPWAPAAGGLVLLIGAFALGRWTAGPPAQTPGEGAAPTFSQLTYLPGIETSPSIGPQGNTFVYVGDATDNADIYIQRVTGQIGLNITPDSPADDTAPALSPDGQLIVFRSERQGGGVFVMGATGESVRRVTDFGYDPAWSPDGREIVLATEAVIDPLARTTRSELWVVRLVDGEQRLLTEGDAVQPSWSPNGRRIAFWSVPPSTAQRDIATIAAAGGEPIPVTDDPWVDWNPVWSPDGKHLYFASDRGGTMNLWRVPIDEASGEVLGAPEPVTTPSKWSGNISFSAAGHLLYTAVDERTTICRVDFDPDLERVAGPPSCAQSSRVVNDLHLSPDGQWLAFTSAGRQEDLFIARADGSEIRQLTDDPHRDRGPQWAPDGSRIAFYSNRGGRYEIWSVHADGSHLEQLSHTTGPSPWFPTWSPDGGLIATSNAEAVSVHELGAASGGPATRLPDFPAGGSFLASSWSPDGAFVAGHAMDDGLLVEGIHLYSLDTGEYTTLTEDGFHPVWLSDSRRLLIWRDDGLSLLRLGEQAPKEVLAGALGDLGWRNFSVSRDDRLIVFAQTTRQGDIWLRSPE